MLWARELNTAILMESCSQFHAMLPWRNQKIRPEWWYKHTWIVGSFSSHIQAIESATGTAHLCTPHTLMAGGVCYTDGCPDLWTNTISHKQLRFFWPLDRKSVCNPTVYSSAKCLIWSIINSVSENSHGFMLLGVRSN